MPQRRKFGIKEIRSIARKSEVHSTKSTEHGCTWKKGQPILAYADQFRTRFESEDVEMPEKEHKEAEAEEKETEQNMEESGNDEKF